MESTINRHLASWGFAEKEDGKVEFEIGGKRYSAVSVEQTYKGNFHLYATTDGKERKFVIGKNKPEYSLIQSVGPANLTVEMLRQMVEKYL